jgi:hypothetical protein
MIAFDPPQPAPLPAAPAPAAPADASRDSAPSGPRIGDAYRWTDAEGVTTWTNRREKIPPRYRDQAQVPDDAPLAR